MGASPGLVTFFFFFLLFSAIIACITQAVIFEITNKCSYTVWAASVPAGGGKELKPDETWFLSTGGRVYYGWIWGRTNCTFTAASGRGRCETRDCRDLECRASGAPPFTLATFSVGQSSDDLYEISLVNGFNIPLEITPNNGDCRQVSCKADITGERPVELRTPGGCNHPCTVFNAAPYCCDDGNCTATYLSDFFETRCPDAISFGRERKNPNFTCPTGSDYRVVFCPPPPQICIRIILPEKVEL